MLVVCDANVLASGTLGLRRTHSAPGAVLRQILRGDVAVALSEPILRAPWRSRILRHALPKRNGGRRSIVSGMLPWMPS